MKGKRACQSGALYLQGRDRGLMQFAVRADLAALGYPKCRNDDS